MSFTIEFRSREIQCLYTAVTLPDLQNSIFRLVINTRYIGDATQPADRPTSVLYNLIIIQLQKCTQCKCTKTTDKDGFNARQHYALSSSQPGFPNSRGRKDSLFAIDTAESMDCHGDWSTVQFYAPVAIIPKNDGWPCCCIGPSLCPVSHDNWLMMMKK